MGADRLYFVHRHRLFTRLANDKYDSIGRWYDDQEINVIRKRLEEGKVGCLEVASYPSRVITLLLSDVLGDSLDLIASEPAVPDTSTWADAWTLIQQYQL